MLYHHLDDSPLSSALSLSPFVVEELAAEPTRALEWVRDDRELLVGCDVGLYRLDHEMNRSDLIFKGSPVVSLDVVDCENAISIIGLRNGSFRLCDPRQPNQQYSDDVSSRRQSQDFPLNKKQKSSQHFRSESRPFPSCIDHIKVLANRHNVLIKDIVGNISLFDVRKLSKVVMSIARSDATRQSKIDYSRFYVDRDESMLLTTGIANRKPTSFCPSSFDLPANRSETVLQVWSLKCELTSLREIPFHIRPTVPT